LLRFQDRFRTVGGMHDCEAFLGQIQFQKFTDFGVIVRKQYRLCRHVSHSHTFASTAGKNRYFVTGKKLPEKFRELNRELRSDCSQCRQQIFPGLNPVNRRISFPS